MRYHQNIGSGSFAKFAAMRRASSRVCRLIAERRYGSPMSVTSGNPLIPVLLGGIGVTVLLIAIRLKNSGRTVITALEAVSEDIITVCGEDCSLR
jgi:hypothetical protein